MWIRCSFYTIKYFKDCFQTLQSHLSELEMLWRVSELVKTTMLPLVRICIANIIWISRLCDLKCETNESFLCEYFWRAMVFIFMFDILVNRVLLLSGSFDCMVDWRRKFSWEFSNTSLLYKHCFKIKHHKTTSAAIGYQVNAFYLDCFDFSFSKYSK